MNGSDRSNRWGVVMSRTWAVLTLLLLLAAVALYVHHVLTTFAGPTVDDSAISYAYASSLAHGHGFRLTPGAAPVEGFSNPLEVISLVPFALANVDLDMAAKAINVGWVALGLLCWGVFLWRNSRGLARVFAVLPCLITLLWPTFNYWTAAGLEGGMLAGLQMLVVLALVRPGGPRRELLLGVLAGLLAWTRPEGAIYGAIAVAAGLLWLPRRWRASLIFAGACLLLVGLRYALFRDVVPNTYWAKVSDANLWKAGQTYVRDFMTQQGRRYLFLLLPLLIPLAPRALVPGLAALTHLAFALLFVHHVGGDWMKQWRFMQFLQGPATALVALGTYAALGADVNWLGRPGRWRSAVQLVLAVVLLWPTVSNNMPLGDWRTRARLVHERRDLDWRKIAICAGFYRGLGEKLQLGRRFVEADIDVGGMAYPPGLDVVDLGGLADRSFGAWTRKPTNIVDYLYGERRPDSIHLHGAWMEGRPVHALSPFAIDYRVMGERFLRDMALGPLTAIRADLVDPPAAPVQSLSVVVDPVTVVGVSAFRDDRGVAVFVHATQNRPAPLPAWQWVDADGKSAPVRWHSGYDVESGPAGTPVVGHALLAAPRLPLRLDGTDVQLESLPAFSADVDTLPALSRLPLARIIGFASPLCRADDILDPGAPAAARARGLGMLARYCGPGLAQSIRADLADQLAREAPSDSNDRTDTITVLSRLGLPTSIGQRMAIEAARRDHSSLDEVALAWAARELASPDPAGVRSGLAILLAAREYERILDTVLARGWLDLPEAQAAVCAAAKALGLRDSALRPHSCSQVPAPGVVVSRQDFENPDDAQLHFVGAGKTWLGQRRAPNIVGGRGQFFLASQPNATGSGPSEVIWGPMAWTGPRFGALLAGSGTLIVEGNEGQRWVEMGRLGARGGNVMRPHLLALPPGNWHEVRVRVVDPSGTGLFADALAFFGP